MKLVERHVFIDAAPARVYELLTDTELLVEWMAPIAEIDPTPRPRRRLEQLPHPLDRGCRGSRPGRRSARRRTGSVGARNHTVVNGSEAARGENGFWTLAEPLLLQAGVTRSTMMGFPCLRLNGDFFASCDQRGGDLVINLDEAAVSQLIDAADAGRTSSTLCRTPTDREECRDGSSVTVRAVGRKGGKPRKIEHSRHLPKVGTPAENEWALHEEREAVLGQIGARNAPFAAKIAVTAVVVVLMVGAILGLLLLIVFR